MRHPTLLLPFMLILVAAPARGQHSSGANSQAIISAAKVERTPQDDLAKVADGFVEQTNALRTAEGLEGLTANAKLMAAAEYFADYMAQTDEYGHEADGRQPGQRAREFDYEYCLVAENIAYQYSTAPLARAELTRRFMEGWKNSPGHRKNLLDGDITDIGVAVAQSEKSGYIYAVQVFGRPKVRMYEFKIDNRSGTTVNYKIGDETYELPANYVRTHQRCRSTPVKFDWNEEAEQAARTVKPGAGHTLVIGRNRDGMFTVDRKR